MISEAIKTSVIETQRLDCCLTIARHIERNIQRDLITVDDAYVVQLDSLLLMAVNMRLAAERHAGSVLSDQTRGRLLALRAELERGGVE